MPPIKLRKRYVVGNDYPKRKATSNISGGRKKRAGGPSVKAEIPPKVMVVNGLTGAARMVRR